MTTPISETDAPATQPKAESFVDWFHINSRLITVGVVLAFVAVAGTWFVRRMSYNEMVSSDKQLLAAKQSLNSGNAPLAESDLKKVADKYASKPAGAEAGILLAQLRMDKGDYQGAVGVLTDLSSKVSSGASAAPVRALLGDAKAQLNKPAEAAADYEKAAGLTTMANEKSFYLAKAGRAYLTAGKTAEARKIFEGLAANTDNPAVSTEAKVRLGELVSAGKA
jgi:predicted negative regulator of RcsB-dependent stress response